MAENTHKPIDECLKRCLLLDDAATLRLQTRLDGVDVTPSLREMIVGIGEDEILALLEIGVAHAVETQNTGMLDRLDRWVREAKKALNMTEDDSTHDAADAELEFALDTL